MSSKTGFPGYSEDVFAGGDANPGTLPRVKAISQDKARRIFTESYYSQRRQIDFELQSSPSKLQHSPRSLYRNIVWKDASIKSNEQNEDMDREQDCSETTDNTTADMKQQSSQIRDLKVVKYKFDDNYLFFVQNFTKYCEDRSSIMFDGSIFFDDAFFPRSMQLSEFVPINVISRYAENLLLQVPSSQEYCKFAPCGSTLYDYFEDYQAFVNREDIIRTQVSFILNSLQCPKLTSFEIDSTSVEDKSSTTRYPTDRLSSWHDSIVSFISRHVKTLKFLQISLTRYKNLCNVSSFCNTTDMRNLAKGSFPKLYELAVTLWDSQVTSCTTPISDSGTSSDEDVGKMTSVWMPAWFPDSPDQYWISLMKSQLHGLLTKLCWVSAANLCWNEVFQPILDANRNSLECIHIIEIEGMLTAGKFQKHTFPGKPKINYCSSCSFSKSNVILSCAAFSNLVKLKNLSLRKINCHLTDLEKLPQCIEELSIDDICIRSEEIANLQHFPKLKALRFSNTSPTCNDQCHEHTEKFGVDKHVLMQLIHSRSLQELCVWRHCLGLDFETLSGQSSFNLTAVLDRINTYLMNICKSPQKISPAQFCEWNSQQLSRDKKLLDSLEQIGFIDDECIVIHEEK